MLGRLKRWAGLTKRDILALYLASSDPRVPWYAKALALAALAYALSPIDLIPDFIPVLGLLDDLILVPAAIILAMRLIPAPIRAELREQASQRLTRLSKSLAGAIAIGAIWLVLAGLAMWAVWAVFGS